MAVKSVHKTNQSLSRISQIVFRVQEVGMIKHQNGKKSELFDCRRALYTGKPEYFRVENTMTLE